MNALMSAWPRRGSHFAHGSPIPGHNVGCINNVRDESGRRGGDITGWAGDILDGRAVGERLRGGDIDLQVLLSAETRLELIEVRAAGFGMPKLKDGETAALGHLGFVTDPGAARPACATADCAAAAHAETVR
jgi:hypothetical protein